MSLANFAGYIGPVRRINLKDQFDHNYREKAHEKFFGPASIACFLLTNNPRLEKSRAHRILWLLEELNVNYELKIFKRASDMLAPPELKKIHPLGKSPIISVSGPGRPEPVVIAESGTIVEYLLDHFGPEMIPKRYESGKDGQVPAETEEWMRYRLFMHYAEGSLMPNLVIALIMNS